MSDFCVGDAVRLTKKFLRETPFYKGPGSDGSIGQVVRAGYASSTVVWPTPPTREQSREQEASHVYLEHVSIFEMRKQLLNLLTVRKETLYPYEESEKEVVMASMKETAKQYVRTFNNVALERFGLDLGPHQDAIVEQYIDCDSKFQVIRMFVRLNGRLFCGETGSGTVVLSNHSCPIPLVYVADVQGMGFTSFKQHITQIYGVSEERAKELMDEFHSGLKSSSG